jgi:hypothetical protein
MKFFNRLFNVEKRKSEEAVSFSFLKYNILLNKQFQNCVITEDEFKKELDILNKSMYDTIKQFPESHKLKGFNEFRSANYLEAISEFDKAISEYSKDWFAFFYKAKSIKGIQNNEFFKTKSSKPNSHAITKKAQKENYVYLNSIRKNQKKYLEEVIINFEKTIDILKKMNLDDEKIIIEECLTQIQISKLDDSMQESEFLMNEALVKAIDIMDSERG